MFSFLFLLIVHLSVQRIYIYRNKNNTFIQFLSLYFTSFVHFVCFLACLCGVVSLSLYLSISLSFIIVILCVCRRVVRPNFFFFFFCTCICFYFFFNASSSSVLSQHVFRYIMINVCLCACVCARCCAGVMNEYVVCIYIQIYLCVCVEVFFCERMSPLVKRTANNCLKQTSKS